MDKMALMRRGFVRALEADRRDMGRFTSWLAFVKSIVRHSTTLGQPLHWTGMSPIHDDMVTSISPFRRKINLFRSCWWVMHHGNSLRGFHVRANEVENRVVLILEHWDVLRIWNVDGFGACWR